MVNIASPPRATESVSDTIAGVETEAAENRQPAGQLAAVLSDASANVLPDAEQSTESTALPALACPVQVDAALIWGDVRCVVAVRACAAKFPEVLTSLVPKSMPLLAVSFWLNFTYVSLISTTGIAKVATQRYASVSNVQSA
jgi:hypothetical protein